MNGMEVGAEYPWYIKQVRYNGVAKWVACNAQTGEESGEFAHYKTAQLWIRTERGHTLPKDVANSLDFTGVL